MIQNQLRGVADHQPGHAGASDGAHHQQVFMLALDFGRNHAVCVSFQHVDEVVDVVELKPGQQLVEDARGFLLLGGLMAVYMSTMFKALEFTSPVATGAVFTLMPLVSAGFAWLFMRQVTRPGVLVSLVIAAAGAIWVIFRGDVGAILAFDVGTGEMIFFVGVVCHAAYAPLLRRLNRGEQPFDFAFWGVAATFLWLFIPGVPALRTVELTETPAIVWIAILYLAIVTTVITFMLIQYASMRLPAPKVLGYGYLTPSFIILLEGLIGHGWVPLSVMAGALVTACGLLVMALLPD